MMNGVRDYDNTAEEMCSRHSVISGSPVEFLGCRRLSVVSLDFKRHRIVGIRVRVYGRQEDVSSVDRQGADVRIRKVIHVHYSR